MSNEKPVRCRLCNHTFFPRENIIKHLMKNHFDRMLHVWFSLELANNPRLKTHINKLFFDMGPDLIEEEEELLNKK